MKGRAGVEGGANAAEKSPDRESFSDIVSESRKVL